MRPLILDYSVERVGEYKAIFQYDDLLSLNVIRTKTEKIPFIDFHNEDINLSTTTKVLNESNIENDGYNISLFEMSTKTRVRQEADDDPISLLELTTKTLVKQESDD
ncbi:hypothetical protein [Flavobacterium chilense]|uniref:Uncharacterized protein n=1 Tax=Flavobacterium chilense TaxID=946677 RepID=A0A1M7IR81_9FLAO|nr:hypothetical protein [Flavobacterium chilense]SHM43306.1 hypothetical protein SAMN05444484_10619 [Flavobacterium chilense]